MNLSIKSNLQKKIKLMLICGISILSVDVALAVQQPNIIVILADDMGYGDIQAYNTKSKIPTPNIDSLASKGISFTDVHTASSVCTPSRYSLLTGRYAWRSRLKSGVTWGYSPLLIEPQLLTLPAMLQNKGYHTAAIGKWHLGLGESEADYFGSSANTAKNDGDIFSRLSPGPNEVGFNYFYGIPASLDMKPYVYVENGRPYSPLTGQLIEPSDSKRVGGKGFWRKGLVAEGFVHEKVLPNLTDKALSYIDQQATNKASPFFLYFALTAPHTPWLATKEFQGKSGAGHYGDFAMQVDDVVGKINKKLDEKGLTEDTLIIFTSDNGAHWLPSDIAEFSHLANGNLRGQKADIHEGGHRVPFIARWPNNIPQNTSTNKAVVLSDLFATLSDIVGYELPEEHKKDIAADSVSFLQPLLGKTKTNARQVPLIHHSLDGMFALRSGHWKLIEGQGSGGFTQPARIDVQRSDIYQLYNLKNDPQEQHNLANQKPKLVQKLLKQLNAARNIPFTRL